MRRFNGFTSIHSSKIMSCSARGHVLLLGAIRNVNTSSERKKMKWGHVTAVFCRQLIVACYNPLVYTEIPSSGHGARKVISQLLHVWVQFP